MRLGAVRRLAWRTVGSIVGGTAGRGCEPALGLGGSAGGNVGSALGPATGGGSVGGGGTGSTVGGSESAGRGGRPDDGVAFTRQNRPALITP